MWVESKIDEIVLKYRNKESSGESLAAFRKDLAEAGLQDMTTEAFVRLAGGSK
jgi:hypothetical protein